MIQQDSRKTRQRIIMIVSGLFFLGSVSLPLVGMFNRPSAQTGSQEISPNQQQAMVEQLKAQEKGYEKVLEREPNNPAALQGLVEIKLKLNDLQGAIAPLEKLIKLYPNEPELKQLLEVVKQQATANPSTPNSPTPKP